MSYLHKLWPKIVKNREQKCSELVNVRHKIHRHPSKAFGLTWVDSFHSRNLLFVSVTHKAWSTPSGRENCIEKNTRCHKSWGGWNIVESVTMGNWGQSSFVMFVVFGRAEEGPEVHAAGWTVTLALLWMWRELRWERKSTWVGDRHSYPWWRRTWKKFRCPAMKCEDNLCDNTPHRGQWDSKSLASSSNKNKSRQCWCERKPQLEQMQRVPDGFRLQKKQEG